MTDLEHEEQAPPGASFRHPVLAGVLGLEVVYALLFLLHSSLVVDGVRWFVLFDDAMISMTYARTFAAGGGLVWYPGAEAVEGYTNFLWVCAMAGVHLLPVPEPLRAGVFAALSLLTVPLTSLFAFRAYRLLAPETRRDWIAGLLVGSYFPFYLWAGLGMEAGFITLLLTVVTCEVLRAQQAGRVRMRVFVALALGVLTRLDFGLFAALAGLFLLFETRAQRREFARVALGLCAVGVATLALCAWQWLYYGDPLPNTFALKLGVPLLSRLARGLDTASAFLSSVSIVILVAATVLFVQRAPVRTRAGAWLLSTVVLALLYNVYAGGDAWEWGANANRFLLPIVPILLLVIAFMIDWLTDASRLPRGQAVAFALLLCVLVSLRMNAGTFAPETAIARLREAALLDPTFTREVHDRYVLKAGLFLREVARRPLTIAVTSAGIAPYVIGEGRFIDLLGRSDREIARGAPVRDIEFLPGHMKWDLDYSIGHLDPDVSIGAPPGPLVAPVRHFTEPVIRIPGLVPIFVKRRVLQEAMLPLPQLVAVYRRVLGGSVANLMGNILEFEGFQFDPTALGFELKQDEGAFTVPAGAVLAFALEATAPLAVTIEEDERETLRAVVQPGQSQEHVVRAERDVEVRIRKRAPESPAGPAGAGGSLRVGALAFR